MSTFPTHCPTAFCEAFTRHELVYLKENQIWGSWYPVMERLLSRPLEMKPVYKEICEHFGYML